MVEPATHPGRKRRLDAERSRAAVLDAAIALFGKRTDASMEDIAAAAGVVRQTVYAHFPSRAALVSAVVERLTAETARTLDALDLVSPPAEDALRQWLEASWSIIDRFPVLLSPLATEIPPAADERERHEPVTTQLINLIHRGREAGIFEDRRPVDWLVAVVIALGHAAGQEVMAGRMRADEARAAYRDSVLRILLNQPATERR